MIFFKIRPNSISNIFRNFSNTLETLGRQHVSWYALYTKAKRTSVFRHCYDTPPTWVVSCNLCRRDAGIFFCKGAWRYRRSRMLGACRSGLATFDTLNTYCDSLAFLPIALARNVKQPVASVCPSVCFHFIFRFNWHSPTTTSLWLRACVYV